MAGELQQACQQQRKLGIGLTLSVAAAAASAAATAVNTEAVDLLKQASKDPSVCKKDVFKALRDIQKQNLPGDDWPSIIGCNQYWRLVYNAGKQAVQASMKDKAGEAPQSGFFFPLTAAQRFNLRAPPNGTLANAVYIPHVAAMKFTGDYVMSKKKLTFDLTGLTLKLGPLKLGPFSIGKKDSSDEKSKPFFIFFYADEDIICAQGKGGGIAYWAKAEPEFVVRKGLEI